MLELFKLSEKHSARLYRQIESMWCNRWLPYSQQVLWLVHFLNFFYYAVVLFSLLKKFKRQPKVQCCESQSLQADKNLIKFLIYGLEERRKGRNLLYS